MKHSHKSKNSNPMRNIKTAFFLNITFTIIEIVGGILTNSVAILSDAVHDLGDSITLGSSLFFEHVSQKERTDFMTFGYRRYSLLGALFTALTLIVGSIYILFLAVPRLMHPETVNAEGMILIAVIGIIFNGLAFFRLHHGHGVGPSESPSASPSASHSESQSEGYKNFSQSNTENTHEHPSDRGHDHRQGIHEKVVSFHLLEDMLGWIAVFIISIIMLFTELPILDPILSIGITIFVLIQIIPSLKTIGRIFLQYAPVDIPVKTLKKALEEIDGVIEAHDIHVWSLDGNVHICTCHLVISNNENLESSLLLRAEGEKIIHSFGINHSTIEIEVEGSKCAPCDV